jgi:predicted Zn-dependent peptidase
MSNRYVTLILLAGLGTLAFAQPGTAPAKAAPKKIAPVKFSDTRLDNGLRVIIAEDHYAPVYAIAVSYSVGSKDERQGRTGFAHLFEHMMFKGSENVGAGEHFFLIFNYGGSMNGTTNTDRTVYYEILPKNQLDLGLFLESDRMRSLAITKENLENQRQAVKEERRLGLDNQAYGYSNDRLNELTYDNFAYHHSVIGSMEDLDSASVEDVQAFFKTYYAPNNAVVAIVGDIDGKDTLARVQKYFGNIPRQEPPKPVDLTEPEMKGERHEAMDDKLARLSQVVINYKIPSATSDDAPALSALGSILGGGETSRLYQKLVKEKEVCSAISAGSAERLGPGALRITCTVRPGKTLQEAESLIAEEVSRMIAAPVSEEELTRVRTSARRSAVGLRESALSRALTLANDASVYNDPNRINTETDRLMAVSAADVQRVARTYLRGDNKIVMETKPAAPKPAAR